MACKWDGATRQGEYLALWDMLVQSSCFRGCSSMTRTGPVALLAGGIPKIFYNMAFMLFLLARANGRFYSA